MKHCANPECAYRTRHGSASEYEDAVTTCQDCGAALVEGVAIAPVRVQVQLGPAPWSRVGITAGFALLCVVAVFVPLPGSSDIDDRRYAVGLLSLFNARLPMLSVVAIGLAPIVSAYTLVEIVAVLVPSWRRLRISGEAGRAKLRPYANGLAGLLAVGQSVSIATYLRGLRHTSVFDDSHSLPPLPWMAIVILPLATLALGSIIRGIDRWGIGDGFSIVFVALLFPAVLELGVGGGGETMPLAIAMLLVIAAAVGWASTRALQREWPFALQAQPFAIEIPPSGLAPLTTAASLVSIVISLGELATNGRFDLVHMLGVGYAIFTALIVASLGVGFSLLFNQPKRVAEIWFGSASNEASVGAIRQQLSQAALRGTAFLIVLALLHDAAPRLFSVPFAVDFSLLVTVVAVVLDVTKEFQFRRSQPELVPVWPMHRVYAVQPVVAALTSAGIPAFVRALHHRTLLQFLGPYLPMTVLVPREHAAFAERIVREKLLPGT